MAAANGVGTTELTDAVSPFRVVSHAVGLASPLTKAAAAARLL